MKKRTKAIHGKHTHDYDFHQGVAHPINVSSTFYFDSIRESEETFEGKNNGYVYSRGRNPSLSEFEEKMTLLEEGGSAVSFSSGMGAIATLLLTLLKKGGRIAAHQVLYGSSHNLIDHLLPDYGIEVGRFNLREEEGRLACRDFKPDVVYFETPCNPTLDIISISGVRETLGEDVCIVVDNTFATPFLQQPLTLGADYVVHSATKYIGGHGDAIGGVVVMKDLEMDPNLRFGHMCEFGTVMSPFNAWIFNRGLKTLSLRMKAHSQNAMAVAKFLEQHPFVEKVYYPGLPSFSGYDIACEQMADFGGMLSFSIKGNEEDACRVVEKMQLFKIAVSLGDVDSLVEHPMKMTHRSYSEEERITLGIDKSLIRLSVGLEDIDDILEDLERSLSNEY